MKKIVIAPLAAIICSAAIAAETTDVSVFGVVDVNTAFVNKGTDNKKHWGIGTNGNSSSRLGFKATQDVGNGLTAIAHLEGAIHADDGTATGAGNNGEFAFKRQATLGLKSNQFGEARVGRDLTPTYRTASKHDVFGGNGIGQFQGWKDWANLGSDGVRVDNMIAYYSPSYAGFTYGVGYAAHEQTNNTQTNRYTGLFADYTVGGVSATFAYASQRLFDGVPVNRNELSLGGSFDAQVVKVSLLLQQVEGKEVKKDTWGKAKMRNIALGATLPMGANVSKNDNVTLSAHEVKAQFAHYEDNEKPKDKANQFSVGYVNNWNDNFALYGTVAYLKNDKNNSLGLSLNPSHVYAGRALDKNGEEKAQFGFQVGAKYKF